MANRLLLVVSGLPDVQVSKRQRTEKHDVLLFVMLAQLNCSGHFTGFQLGFRTVVWLTTYLLSPTSIDHLHQYHQQKPERPHDVFLLRISNSSSPILVNTLLENLNSQFGIPCQYSYSIHRNMTSKIH